MIAPQGRLRARLQIGLFFVVFLLQAPVVFSHENYLLTWFNIDDGFYYFVTARNIAAGLGVTFDGIAPTNGFHPLWMLVITPVFALPGQILPLRVLAALLILINAATAALVFRLAARRLGLPAASLTGLAFALLPAIHNFTARGGMESGLSGLLIVLLLDRAAAADPADRRGLAVAGFVSALAFLARLDNVFLAGFVGLALVFRRVPDFWDRDTRRRLASRGAAYFAPLFLAVAGFMLWSQLGFGTPTPVSGQVKRWWGTLENSVYGFPPREFINYVGQFVTDDPDVGPWSLATAPLYALAETIAGDGLAERRLALAGLGAAAALIGTALLYQERNRLRWLAGGLGLVPLLLGCLVQIGYYKLGGSVAQRPWYWIGEMLWLVLSGGLLLNSLGSAILDAPVPAGMRRAATAAGALILAGLLIQPHLPRLGEVRSEETAAGESYYLRRSRWLEGHTEPGALIGMTGTGSAAYFTEGRSFVNLDGLINSYEYFLSLKNGTADDYLESIGLDYVFGSEYILRVSDPYGGIFEGRLEAVGVFETGERNLVLWRFLEEIDSER